MFDEILQTNGVTVVSSPCIKAETRINEFAECSKERRYTEKEKYPCNFTIKNIHPQIIKAVPKSGFVLLLVFVFRFSVRL